MSRATLESVNRERTSRFLVRAVACAAVVTATFCLTTIAGGAAPSVRSATEAANGHVITMVPGQALLVTLHSTYWTLHPLVRSKVLTQKGEVTTIPVLPSATSGCVPGQGCGTITGHYTANAKGTVEIRATRTSCGEALACSPTRRLWVLTVRVL